MLLNAWLPVGQRHSKITDIYNACRLIKYLHVYMYNEWCSRTQQRHRLNTPEL